MADPGPSGGSEAQKILGMSPAGFGALAGGLGFAGDLLGGLGGGKGIGGAESKLKWAQTNTQRFYNEAYNLLEDANTARNLGYDRAINAAQDIGTARRMDIQRQAKQAFAGAQVAGENVGSSVVEQQLKRGAGRDQAEAMAELDSMLAPIFTDLQVQAGSARAMGLASLAALKENHLQALTSIIQQRAQLHAGAAPMTNHIGNSIGQAMGGIAAMQIAFGEK